MFDYIYPNPTNEFDGESGYRKYQYEQANAHIYGLEYAAEAQAAPWLILNGEFDLLRGNNLQIDDPLPLLPANRFQLCGRLQTSKWHSLYEPYVSVDVESVATQNRVAQYEEPTNGYTLVDVDTGIKFAVGNQQLSVSLQEKNLFDTSYRSHLSRYNEYALNSGRYVMLKISIPFTVR